MAGRFEWRIVATFAVAVSSSAALGDVVITEAPTLGGAESVAGAVNVSGVFVGCARDGMNDRYAVSYDALRGVRTLGTLDGTAIFDCAQDLNDAGLIVGAGFSPVGYVGFTFTEESGMAALPTLPGTWTQHVARAVNGTGLIAGWAIGGGNPQTPIVWEDGMIAALPFVSDGVAFDVGAECTIVGATGGDAVRWTKSGAGESWVMTPLGPPPLGPDAAAVGISADGTIFGQMGEFTLAGKKQAFSWNDGVYTPLDAPVATDSAGALARNAQGIIVGTATAGTPPNNTSSAVRWIDGVPEILNDRLPPGSPWTLDRAWGINDRGQIVGEGTFNGEPRGYLLSPDCNGNGRPDHEDIDGAPMLDVAHVPAWEGQGVTGGVTATGIRREVAQTFVAATGGRLLAARLALGRLGANGIADGIAIPFDIVSTAGSEPNEDDVLASASLLSSFVPTTGTDLVTIVFESEAFDVIADMRYAVVMRAPDVAVGQVDWLTRFPGGYAPGDIASRNEDGGWVLSGADALFEIVVRGTPASDDIDRDGVPDECADACPADLDGDDVIGFTDILMLISAWGPCPQTCGADLNGDGIIGFDDLLMLISTWGPCPPGT